MMNCYVRGDREPIVAIFDRSCETETESLINSQKSRALYGEAGEKDIFGGSDTYPSQPIPTPNQPTPPHKYRSGDPYGPHVALVPVGLPEHLRGDVERRPDHARERLVHGLVVVGSEAEVRDQERRLLLLGCVEPETRANELRERPRC